MGCNHARNHDPDVRNMVEHASHLACPLRSWPLALLDQPSADHTGVQYIHTETRLSHCVYTAKHSTRVPLAAAPQGVQRRLLLSYCKL